MMRFYTKTDRPKVEALRKEFPDLFQEYTGK